MWNVHGLTLRMVPTIDRKGFGIDCPLTLEPITDAGMMQDGGLYQFRYIAHWLDSHTTSPLTSLPLQHTKVFRMSSLKDVLDQFLVLCRNQRDAARAWQEERLLNRLPVPGLEPSVVWKLHLNPVRDQSH